MTFSNFMFSPSVSLTFCLSVCGGGVLPHPAGDYSVAFTLDDWKVKGLGPPPCTISLSINTGMWCLSCLQWLLENASALE